ncbi:MAG: iron-containing alcohol dehydrogenase [Bacteroidales bacterium]|nr:iron-containing alcohol dehydrogenase [Bacteroidales bacterium]MBN2750245.1 iron-containing alcohol dehydrogenase [Bacteroidales bacterium]
MKNFDFYNPVKILFGEGKMDQLPMEIPANAVILMTYGGGSIKKNGVYDKVKQSLAGYKLLEFGGIEANPKYETLMRAVELARTEKVTFLLAVGGGSVLDGTKFISAAINYAGDPWEILAKRGAVIENVVPIGSVLTLAATGSEMNSGGVISKLETKEKLAFGSPLLFPKFSILDPTVTYSLPVTQIANGVVDAFIHVTEQYLTFPEAAPLQDRFAEGILQTLVEIGPQALINPLSYDLRANLMWSATMALNGLLSCGVTTDWATHMIGHELTAFFGLDHGVTLAIVLPALLREAAEEKREKLLQYGARVWGITVGTEDRRIEETIQKTESFFRSLGIKTKLSEHGVTKDQIVPIVERLADRKWKLGERRSITPERVERILLACF